MALTLVHSCHGGRSLRARYIGCRSLVMGFWPRAPRPDHFQDQPSPITAVNLGADRAQLRMPEIPFIRDAVDGTIERCFPGTKFTYIGVTSNDQVLERNVIVRVSAEALRTLQPCLTSMMRVPAGVVIVPTKSEVTDYDFMSRYFAPACGVAEDPVTGSAHSSLPLYWTPLCRRRSMRGFQALKRGGSLT